MSDHLHEQQRTWSPGQAVLPPDPEGHNRLLDRGAAEHLASVAPWLAPEADAAERAARGHELLNRHGDSSPRDWPGDRAHENGNYENRCGACGLPFLGHKRRPVCRACAVTPPSPVAPCLSCQAGLCGEHGAPRVETTTGIGESWTGTGQQGEPVTVARFVVVGSDGFDHTTYEVGRYATREEALSVVAQKTREHEKSQPGGMPDRFSAHRVPLAPAPAATCRSCGGTGRVDLANDFDPGAGSFGSEPCADCQPPAAASRVLAFHDEAINSVRRMAERSPAPAANATRWRKRPVVVTAVQVTDEWFDGDHPNDLHPVGLRMDPVSRVVEIPTLEGTMTGNVGDWIITGVKGERYPCKPDIFAATYEPADAPAPAADSWAADMEDLLGKIARREHIDLSPAEERLLERLVPAPAPAAEATSPVKTLSALLLAGAAKLVTRLTPEQACDVVREIARQNGHEVVIEAPAAEAKGEMSREAFERLTSTSISYVDMATWDLLLAHDAALRARAREAESFAAHWIARAATVLRERDEAREQRDAATSHCLCGCPHDAHEDFGEMGWACDEEDHHGLCAWVSLPARNIAVALRDGRDRLNVLLSAANARAEAYQQDRDLTAHRLAAAEAEVTRLRECHRTASETVWDMAVARPVDDPSLDATDGAHPAWWRGCDHGVRKAAERVEQAFTGPIANVADPCDATGAVRQRVADLLQRCRRLEEDKTALLERWATGRKGEVPK